MKRHILYMFLFIGIICCSSTAHAKSTYNEVMAYKYKLSLIGINYMPWKDRLNNDLVLMRKLLSLDKYRVTKLSGYQIVSTKGKTFMSNKKKIFFINYKTSPSRLVKLFVTNKKKGKIKSRNKSKRKSKSNSKSKSKRGSKSRGDVNVQIAQPSRIKSIELVPAPVEEVNPYMIKFIEIK